MITRKRLQERVERMAYDGIDIGFHVSHASVHDFYRLSTANGDKPLTGIMTTGQLWNWFNGFDAGFAQGLKRPPRSPIPISQLPIIDYQRVLDKEKKDDSTS